MKKQNLFIEEHQYNNVNQSCPAILEEDITKSINEEQIRIVRSQQFKPNRNGQINQGNQNQIKQPNKQLNREQRVPERQGLELKIQVNMINKKGTDFDCQKVQSLELSCQQESYRSQSLKSRKNRHSQQQIQEPRSGKKLKKNRQESMRQYQHQKREQIKDDILNVLIAGAQNTGKSIFIRCFKKKQRKNEEPHIKNRTRQIKYQFGLADQNLLNRRNSVYFIDFPGFAPNEQDNYLREIQQYAIDQSKRYEIRPQEDRRIHCCLYFLRGPRIEQSDIHVLKKLSSMFNLIPVISKSDHYTKEEIIQIKEQFYKKIERVGQVHLYDLEEFYRLKYGTDRINTVINSSFGKFPPFVIASSIQKQSPESGSFVRKYPWGKLEIQNLQHTDFQRLCELLVSDVRNQFLNNILPLSQKEQHQQVVEEVIGVIGNHEIQPKQNWRNIFSKNTIIVGSLIGIIVIAATAKEKIFNIFSNKIYQS